MARADIVACFVWCLFYGTSYLVDSKVVGEWTAWVPCGNKCNVGTRSRYRNCTNSTSLDPCVLDDILQTEVCNPDNCEVSDLVQRYEPCNATCSEPGVEVEHRVCSSGAHLPFICTNYRATPCALNASECPSTSAPTTTEATFGYTTEGTTTETEAEPAPVATNASSRPTTAALPPPGPGSQTGDPNNTWIWILVAFGCIFVLMIVVLTIDCRNRQKRRKKVPPPPPHPPPRVQRTMTTTRETDSQDNEMTVRPARETGVHIGTRPFTYTIVHQGMPPTAGQRPQTTNRIVTRETPDGASTSTFAPPFRAIQQEFRRREERSKESYFDASRLNTHRIEFRDGGSPVFDQQLPPAETPAWGRPEWARAPRPPPVGYSYPRPHVFSLSESIPTDSGLDEDTLSVESGGLSAWIVNAERSDCNFDDLLNATPY